MSIVLARIDDRLIHGQVMTAWVSYAGGKEILIVDDKVQSFQTPVSRRIHKINHADIFLLDK